MKPTPVLLTLMFFVLTSCGGRFGKTPAPPAYPVTPEAIGPVRLGLTVAALTNQGLRAEYISKYRAGGWKAWLIYPGITGRPAICAVAFAPGKDAGMNKPITRVESVNPEAGTACGLRPGMPFKTAVGLAGEAVITFYSSIEDSPEYVVFGSRTNTGILFRAASKAASEAGKYIQNEGGIILTGKYRSDARIERILVYSGEFIP